MHTRLKSHLTKFNSKLKHIREGSAFWKHLENTHGGLKQKESFETYFDVQIVKAYTKPITRVIEEGTFIVNSEAELLNSKNEWHQPKIIRTTILQGGAEMAGPRRPSYQRAGESDHVLVTQEPPAQVVDREDPVAVTRRSTRRNTAAGGGSG